MNSEAAGWFAEQLLSWYDQHGRKHLPWQQDRSPYRVWLSEIMLQQTQVATVIPYFQRFIEHFPSVHDLANASGDDVMKLWAGLGYYARARNLHACARQVSHELGGIFPDTVDALQQLPGIGRSTAGAIVAQAFNKQAVILDGNVKRVLARYRMISGWTGKSGVQKELWQLAEALIPDNRPADYTQAIMDLGSMICRRSRPGCEDCPIASDCDARKADMTDRFPEKQARRPLPEKTVCVMICYPSDNPGRVLLEKRPPAGIWGGLWSLPQCDPVQVSLELFAATYGYQVERIEEVEEVMHRLTHFQLRIQPFWIAVQSGNTRVRDASVQWCEQERINEYGMPKPVTRLVDHFFSQRRTDRL